MRKQIILPVLIIAVIIVGLYSSFNFILKKDTSGIDEKVTMVGLNNATKSNLSNALRSSFSDVKLLEEGDSLLSNGNSKEAIVYFEDLLKNESFDMKGLARNHLIEAYEKDRQYEKAHALLYEDTTKYKVPTTHEIRVPIEERVKYLKYASEGNYTLALQHAKLSLEAEEKISNRPKEVIDRARMRLNDLKASREYIESLK